MKKAIVLCLIATVFLQTAIGQKIDNTVSFRDIKSDNYFRFNYDNDFFAATDKNYTQGYSLELAAPFFKTNPVNHLFYIPKNVETRYGLAVEHIGYTPARFDAPDIQFGDRPFASAIMLKSFSIATDSIHKSRFSSAFSLGLIGPGAFGKEMQVAIHKATGNKIPLGWRHQIKNDLLVNYEIGYEKQLVRYNDLFALQANAHAKVGTLFTNAMLGLNTTFGIINTPFSSSTNSKGFKLFGYVQPMVNLIGYDATLQGGLLNKKSPYTIASRDIERLTGELNCGIVLKTKTLYLEYSRSVRTKEFKTGSGYQWGGIKIGFTI